MLAPQEVSLVSLRKSWQLQCLFVCVCVCVYFTSSLISVMRSLGELIFCDKHVQDALKESMLLNGKVVVTTSLTRDPYQSGQV